MSQKVFSGLGSISKLINILKDKNVKSVLLVTGKNSFTYSGAEEALIPLFDQFKVIRFKDFEINPKFEDAMEGTSIARKNNIDAVISIGGGSVIDIAKLILAFIEPNQNQQNIVLGIDKPIDPKIPHISIPTTAGTGSESTHFAVVYLNKIKYSVSSNFMTPKIAILDSELIKSNSPSQKAYNGLDALAQAIESHWATGSNEESRSYSREAIPILYSNLPRIVDGSADMKDYQNFIFAANLAGKAINISKTTAPHAFSYSFTSKYGIPHGHAVWLTLPKIFEIHNNTKDENNLNLNSYQTFRNSISEIITLLGIKENRVLIELKKLLDNVGLEFSMEKLGVSSKSARREIAEEVNLERLKNNPVSLSEKDIQEIFNL